MRLNTSKAEKKEVYRRVTFPFLFYIPFFDPSFLFPLSNPHHSHHHLHRVHFLLSSATPVLYEHKEESLFHHWPRNNHPEDD